MEYIAEASNRRAVAEGAGSKTYADWVPFDQKEIYKFFGLLFANALSPKPQIIFWFLSSTNSKLFGNDHFSKLFDKRIVGGRVISGERRWRMFRRFMTLYDCREDPRKLQKKDPLWKVAPLLDHLRKNCQRCWVTGKWVSIDEQTIGFKGRHGLSLRITYKKEGDGYQCDAVCEEGYTYSFYFRHGDAPETPENLKQFNLSPTARRVIYLLRQLPNQWTHCFMDNLFNSRKLYSAAYQIGALCHGVCRTNGRGLCEETVQKVEPDIAKARKLHGTTKAAVLMDDPLCPDLICCSVYDTKPVHLLTTCAEYIDWTEMKRTVFDPAMNKTVPMKFLRLNLIDMYNNNMNSVDLADQLRNHYRFNHWLRNRKWWWAIFLWAVGVAATNAYIIYERIYEEEKKKKLKMLPKKWSHMEFLEELINDFVGWVSSPTVEDTGNNSISAGSAVTCRGSAYSSVASSSRASQEQEVPQHLFDLTTEDGREEFFHFVAPMSLTKKRMDGAYFSCRFDGQFHPSLPVKQIEAYCQYCRYKFTYQMTERERANNPGMKKNRYGIQRCLTCRVNLCWECRNTWHGLQMSSLNAFVSTNSYLER